LTSIGVPSHKVTWISNGVCSTRLRALDSEKYKDKKRSQQFTLTYTGAIGRANNLIVAMKAAKLIQSKYSQIKILLVGDGPEKQGLVQFAQKNNIRNVEFIAQVPKDQLIEIFHGSDAFYFNLQNSPVFKYGISSNKLFDYFAGGKPIIFSTNSSNNPVAEAEAGLTVAPDQPKILANTIIQLYKMPTEKKNKMSENGRNYVEKNFSIPILTNKLEYSIKSVLAGHKYDDQ
ncbi:MAG: glycosyltransferase family 4 protein, partial [bacterium]